jgi:hypothetical protein
MAVDSFGKIEEDYLKKTTRFYINKVYKCDCYSEALEISHDKENKLIELCMWENGNPRKRGFFHRLRFALKAFFRDEYYTDEMILDYNTANKLAIDLQEMILNGIEEKEQTNEGQRATIQR